MKTIREHLEGLPPGYRERALANMNPKDSSTVAADLPDALMEAFEWTPSLEEFSFWSAVHDWSMGRGALPPLPPLPVSGVDILLAALERIVNATSCTPDEGNERGIAAEALKQYHSLNP